MARVYCVIVVVCGFAACGWGETRPIQSNDNEAGMQANRRVQIFALDPKLRAK